MAEKFKSAVIFGFDFEKLQEEYPWLLWLNKFLKRHGFLEVYTFEYVFHVSYQADSVRTEEEIREMLRDLDDELPWLADCGICMNYMEPSETQDITRLLREESPEAEPADLSIAEKDNTNDYNKEIPPLLEAGAQKNMTVKELMAALADYAPDAVVGVRVEEGGHPFGELGEVRPVVEMENNQTHPVLHIEKFEVKNLP